jgi:signal transduction histidine kinase/ActR/RegA family two-component response regulator
MTPSGELGDSYVGNLLRALENQLHIEFSFINVPFGEYFTPLNKAHCQVYILAEPYAKQLGFSYTAAALLETEIVLLSNHHEAYFSRPELTQQLKIGSVSKILIDAFGVPESNKFVDTQENLIAKIQHHDIDAIAIIKEQAGYLISTRPKDAFRVIANAAESYRFVLGASPGHTALIQLLQSGLRNLPQDVFDYEYRRAMNLVPVREINSTPVIVLSLALFIVIIGAAVLIARSRRQAAEKAHLAQMQNNFLSNMSHELRTPLNGIFGIFQFLQKEELPAATLDLVNVGMESTRTLSLLINDILDFDKLNQGKVSYNPRPVNLATLLGNLTALHRFNAEQKGLKLSIDIASNIPSWLALDPMRIEQLGNNILSNAIKFTHRGSVTISATFQQDSLSLAFIDTGVGMSHELQKVVFERFTQGQDNKTNAFRGTGLGMAISMSLAKLMSGNITVKSKIGEGSTFIVSIPTHETPPSEQLTTPFETLSGLHILLCDDEKVTLKVTSVLLDRLSVSYSTASNGREALSATFNDDFDAILMDINMPEMDGIAFLKNYRQRGGNTPVIAFTANAMPDDIQHYFSLGFSEVLVKPVSLEALQQCLQPHLAHANPRTGSSNAY